MTPSKTFLTLTYTTVDDIAHPITEDSKVIYRELNIYNEGNDLNIGDGTVITGLLQDGATAYFKGPVRASEIFIKTRNLGQNSTITAYGTLM